MFGKKLLQGFNDLATTHPELAKEWHPVKNERLTPNHVGIGSNGKVWWQCEKGHEWEANLSQRSKGAGCPYCCSKSGLHKFKSRG